MEDVPGSPLGRFRFSIRSILVTMAFVGLTLVIAQLWREVGPLREEVRRLRVETGRLSIEDSSRVYGFPIATNDGEGRRWRLYLPPGRSFTVYAYSGTLPDASSEQRDQKWFDKVRVFAIGGSLFSMGMGGEIIIDSQIENVDGRWKLKLSSSQDNGGITTRSSTNIVQPSGDWLSRPGRVCASSLAAGAQTEFDPNRPVLLLHLMRPDTTGGGVASPRGNADGIAVWIEPSPVAKSAK